LALDVTMKDYDGLTSIHQAIFDMDDTCDFVSTYFPFSGDWDGSGRYGNYINMAASESSFEMVEGLLKHAPMQSLEQIVNQHCEFYGTPLYAASLRNEITIMEMLIQHGTVVNLVGGPLGTPLSIACEMGRIEAVALLLKHEATLETVASAGPSHRPQEGTLFSAIEAARDHKQVLRLLRNYKEKGAEGLGEALPTIAADLAKVDEFLARLKERGPEDTGTTVISNSTKDGEIRK